MNVNRFIKCEQRSQEWFQLHIGTLTASHAADIMAFLKKGGESADRRNYRGKKLSETVSQMLDNENFVSPEMQWGIDHEDAARRAYELKSGNLVDQIGFVWHPTIEHAGASPDGLIDDDGCLEIKCPKTSTHLRWARDGVVPMEHRPQIYFQMACAGRAWCDFVSYDPRLSKNWLAPNGKRYNLQLFVRRLHADPTEIAAIEDGFRAFLCEMQAEMVSLADIFPEADEPPAHTEPLGEEWLSDDDIAGLI